MECKNQRECKNARHPRFFKINQGVEWVKKRWIVARFYPSFCFGLRLITCIKGEIHYYCVMEYQIEETVNFTKWLLSLRDKTVRTRIVRRLDSAAVGSFGDHKQLNDKLFEMRFFFGAGYRVYYTFKGDRIILLLAGGDKSSQKKDIAKAMKLIKKDKGI